MGRKRRMKGRDWSKKRETASSAKGRTDGGVEGDRGGGGDGASTARRGRNTDGEKWFQTWVLRNRAFEAYYQAMGIMEKEEWPLFMKVLRDPLPACFRVHSDCSFKEQVKKQLMEHLSAPMMIDGKEVEAVEELKWYPGGLAYRLGCDRRFIRKQPNLADFHTWLTALMETGNITRQEAVSMLPPLFLDVQPKHLVLDMCAAPGSKTAQLIEMVSAREDDEDVPTDGPAKEDNGEVGLVLANDGDRDRTYMLSHQCKRVKCPAVCITWCLAQAIPNLGASSTPRGSDKGVFDRVLADVPCSGDGTLRKQPSIWRTWTVAGGLALHPLQLLIALRGVAVLKIGGKMVYSTCSLNPIEDEAVVAELLRRCKGNLQLLDCSSMLTGLKTRRGLDTWPVLTGSARFKGVKTPRDARLTEVLVDSKTKEDADVNAGSNAVPPAVDEVSTESATALTGLDDLSKAVSENGVKGVSSIAAEGEQGNGDQKEVGVGGRTEIEGGEGAGDDSLTAENEDQGEEGGQQDVEMEGDGEFPWPALASDTPLQDAVKAGLRHHPSFAEKDGGTARKIRPSFFPPSAEEANAFKLERCMRMLPQDQDTGGFFVAVLAKTGPILWQDLISPGENLAGDEQSTSPDPLTVTTTEGNLQRGVLSPKQPPTVAPDSATVATGAENTVAIPGAGGQERAAGETDATDDNGRDVSAVTVSAAGQDKGRSSGDLPRQEETVGGRGGIGRGERGRGGRGRGRGRGRGKANAHRPEVADREEYVRLENEKWPKIKGWFGIRDGFPDERLYTRKAGSKGVSYVAPATKTYLLDDPAGTRLQMVHAGVKVFERNSNARSTIEFRICQEGLDIVLPYMTKRVTRRASAEDMSRALDGEIVPMEALSPAMQSDLEGEEEGTYVMVHTDPASNRSFSACVWKGRGNNIAAMISKDIIHGLKLEMKAHGVYVDKPDSR